MSARPCSVAANNSQFSRFANLIAASTVYLRKVISDCEMGRRASLVSSRARFADPMVSLSRSPGNGGTWRNQGTAAVAAAAPWSTPQVLAAFAAAGGGATRCARTCAKS
jgi:hypothetical protein